MDFNYSFNINPYHYGNFSDLVPVVIAVLSVVAIICFFVLIACIISYIFNSISLYTMAKKRGLDHPWFAWVPLVNNYLLGELINDQVSLGSLHLSNASLFLVLVPAIYAFILGALSYIPLSCYLFIFPIVILVLLYNYTALYWLYRIYSPQNAVLFLLLSIFIPIASPFILFSLRHYKPNFSGVPVTRPCSKNTKEILSLALGILSIITNIGGNGFLIGTIAIIFGIIAYQELNAQQMPTTLVIIGLVCGSTGLLLSMISPFINLNLLGLGTFGIFNHSIHNHTNFYPLI
ncbi:MAG: hypothetical protein RR310_03865 [Eubacterium sp.]